MAAEKEMKTTEATPMDCIVCDCPYCNKKVIELNGDLRDIMGGDIEDVTEVECPFCKQIFVATID